MVSRALNRQSPQRRNNRVMMNILIFNHLAEALLMLQKHNHRLWPLFTIVIGHWRKWCGTLFIQSVRRVYTCPKIWFSWRKLGTEEWEECTVPSVPMARILPSKNVLWKPAVPLVRRHFNVLLERQILLRLLKAKVPHAFLVVFR